jgi:hypothetical protein
MNTHAERLKAHWISSGAKVGSPARPEAIEAFEARYEVQLPDDLREYFLVVNGLEEDEWDDQMTEWYPLEKWRRLTETGWSLKGFQDPASYFFFADYSLDALGYVIRLSANRSDPNLIMRLGGVPDLIAESFSQLIEAYLVDPAALLR